MMRKIPVTGGCRFIRSYLFGRLLGQTDPSVLALDKAIGAA